MATRLQKLGKTLKNTGLSMAAGMTYGAFGAPGMAAVGAAGAGYSAIKNILKKDKDEKEEKVERQPSLDNSILEKILGTLQSIESALTNSPVARKTHETKAEKFARVAADVKAGRMSPSEAVQTLVTRKEKNMMAEQALSAAGIKTDDKQYAKLKNDILQGIENELNSETGINAIWEELQKSNEFLETMVKGNEEQQFESDKKQDELISAIKSRDSDGKPEEKKGGLFDTIKSWIPLIGGAFASLAGFLTSLPGKFLGFITFLKSVITFAGPLLSAIKNLTLWIGDKALAAVKGLASWAGRVGGAVLDKAIPAAKNVGGAVMRNAGNFLKAAGRFAGPAAMVAGAGMAGWEAGQWLNENTNIQKNLSTGVDAVQRKLGVSPEQQADAKAKEFAQQAYDDKIRTKGFVNKRFADYLASQGVKVDPSKIRSDSIERNQTSIDSVKQSTNQSKQPIINVPPPTVIQQPASPVAQSMPEARNPDNTFLRLSDRMFVPSML